MNHPENECRGCGDEISEHDSGHHAECGYCSEKCFDNRPLGTGYSKSDYDHE